MHESRRAVLLITIEKVSADTTLRHVIHFIRSNGRQQEPDLLQSKLHPRAPSTEDPGVDAHVVYHAPPEALTISSN